jgi:hypothetical protein
MTGEKSCSFHTPFYIYYNYVKNPVNHSDIPSKKDYKCFFTFKIQNLLYFALSLSCTTTRDMISIFFSVQLDNAAITFCFA